MNENNDNNNELKKDVFVKYKDDLSEIKKMIGQKRKPQVPAEDLTKELIEDINVEIPISNGPEEENNNLLNVNNNDNNNNKKTNEEEVIHIDDEDDVEMVGECININEDKPNNNELGVTPKKGKDKSDKKKNTEKNNMNIEFFFQPKDKSKGMTLDRKGSTLTFGNPSSAQNDLSINKTSSQELSFNIPNEQGDINNIQKIQFPLIQENSYYTYDTSLLPLNIPQEQKNFYSITPNEIANVDEYNTKLVQFLKRTEQHTKNPRCIKLVYIHNSAFPNKTIPEKAPNKLNPKDPFQKDDYIIDYDKDSEEEYLEENAEDLQSNENSAEEEDEEDEQPDQGEQWIVPDGHLSEDELSEKDAMEDRALFEKSKNKMGGIMDILEIRKNFNKPVVIDFKQLNLSNVSNTKEKNLSIKLQMTIFKHYESVEETGDVLMGDEENKDVGFPIKIMRKKIKATGIKNSILDHLEDIIKQIHGSFMTKEQMIIILNEKFSDIPKKTLDNFFKDKCLKVKHNINQKKYWLVKHETLDELNLSSVEVNKILEENYKQFEEKEKKRLEELELNKQKNMIEKPNEGENKEEKKEGDIEEKKEKKIRKKKVLKVPNSEEQKKEGEKTEENSKEKKKRKYKKREQLPNLQSPITNFAQIK